MTRKPVKKVLGSLIATSAIGLSAAIQAQSDGGLTLEEIVVTAQFIEQDLQDTPVAITAVSGEMLEARGQQTVEQISAQAPNVTLTKGGQFAGPALIGFIRGVGQSDFNPALEPGVGMYVDDVYYSTLTGSVLDLLDLDRLEVLRGPQGTLAGKNSIGGSIKLYSKKPDADANAYIEAGIGSYDAVSFRGATNLTLIEDSLYARISGVSRSQDGHVKRLDYGCATGDESWSSSRQGAGCRVGTEGGVKYTAARLALRWIASDDLEVNFSADVLDDTSEAPANVILGVSPTVAPVFGANGSLWETVAIPASLGGNVGCMFIAYGSASCNPNSPNNPYVNYSTYLDTRNGSTIKDEQVMESEGYSLNIDYQITEDLQLQSITGYRDYEAGWGNDADGTPMPVQQLYQRLVHTQKSQEFRLNGRAGSFLDYTVGAFYFDAKTEMDARVNLGYVGFDFIHGPDPVDVTTWALFAHTIFHFTDSLDLSVGVRYSDDQKDYTFQRHNADATMSEIQPCIGPPGTPGNPSNCLISSLNGVSSSFKGDRTDYRVALSYNITDSVMTYVQYATGFKGGGINPRPFYNVQAVPFEPEELDAIELGVKAELFDHRLRLNAAVFQNDYQDVQLQFNSCAGIFPSPFDVPCLAHLNASDAEVKGAELEFDLVLGGGFQMDGSISFLDFEFTKVDPNLTLKDDAIMPYTPEVTWSVGLQYEVSTAAGTFRPRIDVSYQDDVYTAPDNTEAGKIDDYQMVNANLTWVSRSEDWQVSLIGRNLTDELYYTSITDATGGLAGSVYASPGLPRNYMLTVRRNF